MIDCITALTFEVSGVSSSVYLYNFGDGTVVNHTCSKVTHRYTDSGRYTFSVLVTYGVNIYQQVRVKVCNLLSLYVVTY